MFWLMNIIHVLCKKNRNDFSGFLVSVSEVRYFKRLKLWYKRVIPVAVIILKIMMEHLFRMVRKTKKNFQHGLGGAIPGKSVVFCAKAGVTQTLLFHFKVKAQKCCPQSWRDFYFGSRRESSCCKFGSCGGIHPALLTAGLCTPGCFTSAPVLPVLREWKEFIEKISKIFSGVLLCYLI